MEGLKPAIFSTEVRCFLSQEPYELYAYTLKYYRRPPPHFVLSKLLVFCHCQCQIHKQDVTLTHHAYMRGVTGSVTQYSQHGNHLNVLDPRNLLPYLWTAHCADHKL